MKKLIPLLLLLMLSACSTFRPLVFVPLQEKAVSGEPSKVVTVSYSESIFQERFMSIGGIVGYVLFTGPLDVVTLGQLGATEALNNAVYTPEARTSARHENSEYEKLLGKFDVQADFNMSLNKQIKECVDFDIEVTEDPRINVEVIGALKDPIICDSTKDAPVLSGVPLEKLKNSGAPYVLGIKFSYGLGARAGNEQLGLTKLYRPFVKMIGIMIDTETGDVVWRNFFLVFGPKGYRGGDADVENLDAEELTSTFQDINVALVKMLVDALNGEPVPQLPFLVGLSPKIDFTF